MNKQSLADIVHNQIGGTKVQSESVVDSLIEAIKTTLAKGEEVSIAGLGIFYTKFKPSGMKRNPKTGEQVKVEAKSVPKFRPAKNLKDIVEKVGVKK